jgi:hypothetical protein
MAIQGACLIALHTLKPRLPGFGLQDLALNRTALDNIAQLRADCLAINSLAQSRVGGNGQFAVQQMLFDERQFRRGRQDNDQCLAFAVGVGQRQDHPVAQRDHIDLRRRLDEGGLLEESRHFGLTTILEISWRAKHPLL